MRARHVENVEDRYGNYTGFVGAKTPLFLIVSHFWGTDIKSMLLNEKTPSLAQF
jgi:hypothetical protein